MNLQPYQDIMTPCGKITCSQRLLIQYEVHQGCNGENDDKLFGGLVYQSTSIELKITSIRVANAPFQIRPVWCDGINARNIDCRALIVFP